MTDLTHSLLVSAVMADREREAQAIARAAEAVGRHQGKGWRAGFAARLARIAIFLDREAAHFWLTRDGSNHLTNGSPS